MMNFILIYRLFYQDIWRIIIKINNRMVYTFLTKFKRH